MKRLLTWLISLLLGGSLANAQEKEEPLDFDDGLHVVVLGSSTAAGIGPAHPQDAWVNRLRRFLKSQDPSHRVTNLAEGGYLTYQIMPTTFANPRNRPKPDRQRNITMAVSLQPDLIIINVPSNDAAAGYGVQEQQNNFRVITQVARKAGIPVWVSTTQPRMFSPKQVEVQETLRDWILNEYGEDALNFWDGLADCAGWPKTEFDSGDGAHLNGEGHRLLFERVIARYGDN